MSPVNEKKMMFGSFVLGVLEAIDTKNVQEKSLACNVILIEARKQGMLQKEERGE